MIAATACGMHAHVRRCEPHACLCVFVHVLSAQPRPVQPHLGAKLNQGPPAGSYLPPPAPIMQPGVLLLDCQGQSRHLSPLQQHVLLCIDAMLHVCRGMWYESTPSLRHPQELLWVHAHTQGFYQQRVCEGLAQIWDTLTGRLTH